MHLNHTIQDDSHVIPVTPCIPNRHTTATIRIADACHDHARLIATRITANTGVAKTRHTFASTAPACGPRCPTMPRHSAVLTHPATI
jgi:hypothetical protein